MRRKRIRLTEDQLCRIVKESVYSMLIDDGERGGKRKEGIVTKFSKKAPKIGRLAGTLAASDGIGNIFTSLGDLAASFFKE